MITDRIDAITEISERYRRTIIPAPPSVKIELTARCDLKCFFCASSHHLRKRGDMDFKLLERILNELKEVGVDEIGLFYLGESLLYPRLAETIRLAEKIGFGHVFLTTNGRLLTRNKAKEIMCAGLDSLKFSFNFETREQYRKLTGVDAFETVIKNIENAWLLRRQGIGHCAISASSIQYNGEQLSLMEKADERIIESVDQHYWLPFYNQAGYTKGGAGNPGRIGAMRPVLPCWQLFKEGHITWQGVLVGCCFAYEPKWDFGDLKKMSFMDAWNSEAAQKLREASLNKNVIGSACEKCING